MTPPSTARTGVPIAQFDTTGTIRIGREVDNDIVLPDLWVSRRHAELRHAGSEYLLVDLGSSNGLHQNGRRVLKAVLAAGDRFAIGRHEFLFDGQHVYQYDGTGPTSVVADDITVDVGRKNLLDDVSFALRHGTLLGIVGPSGSGKSTLLKTMTGFRPVTRGRLLYDGRDLYENYEELRHRIGTVPQDDVLHRRLTVRRALRFAASLRFASDVPRKDRRRRVDDVIRLLGLTDMARQRIDTLSGGQRKRTSVALELLSEPSLLALDEPTSGLDPALDREIMLELRRLANAGRTVVVVTHNVLHLDLCDRVLVMCLGGRMGYFGPPDKLLAFFQAEGYADVFEKVTQDADRWTQIYRNSEIYRTYVGEVALDLLGPDSRATVIAVPTPRPSEHADAHAGVPMPARDEATPRPPERADVHAGVATPSGAAASELAVTDHAVTDHAVTDHAVTDHAVSDHAGNDHDLADHAVIDHVEFADAHAVGAPAARSGVQDLSVAARARHPTRPLRQFVTLCVRMLAVILSDRGYTLFLLFLPVALAGLSYAVPGDKGLGPDPGGYSLEAQRLLVIFVVGAAFIGVAVAIREIVNEQAIYRRERAIGLSPSAYLASKLAVLLVIDAVQVALFVYLSMLTRAGPVDALVFDRPLVEIMVAVTLVAVASTALGLLASALVTTTDQTTPILVVSVMTQLVLSGGLFAIDGQRILEVVSVVDPARWGFAGAAATTNLLRFPFPDPLWEHVAWNWWRACIALAIQVGVLLVATRLVLRRFEPGKD